MQRPSVHVGSLEITLTVPLKYNRGNILPSEQNKINDEPHKLFI